MKTFIGIIILYGCIPALHGQPTFKKVIPDFLGLTVLKNPDNNYIFGKNSIISVDSSANINFKAGWFSDLATIDIWGFILSDNKYLLTGYESLGTSGAGNFLLKADSNGTIIWKHVYDNIPLFDPFIIPCTDGKILLAHDVPGNNPPFSGFTSLYKLDSSGNCLWHKYYNGNFWQGESIGLQSAGQNYILGLPGSSNLGFGLIKLDTAGSVLWCKTYFRASAFILIQMAENSDGSLTLLGITNPKTTWNTPQSIFLMKVDSAGSFLWCKSYGDFFGSFYGGSYTMKRAADGGYIISAPITPLIRSGSDLMIIKTDSSGNLEWSRSHGEIGTNETSIDAFPTSDGGYFVVGTTDAGIPGSGYYIVKTDSLGFAGCQEYTDTLIVNNIFTTDSAIAISDTLVPVLTFNSTVQDTTLPIPPVYNGCLLNAAQSHDFTRSKSFAYPNPSNGIVKIKSIEPFTKGSYLTVYDSMGRIIMQKPIAKEEDKQIDLTRQGSGIYLLRIKEGEKVSESKVVVE